MLVVPWVLLLVVIVVATGMPCWINTTKKGIALKIVSHSITQSTVNQIKKRKKEIILEEKEGVMYDELKPNCAETAISLKSNIAYTTVKHTSVL